MPKVVFTAHLRPCTGGMTEIEAEGARVCDLLHSLEARVRGIRHCVVDDQGALRRHVNIFVDGCVVEDRLHLSDPLRGDSVIHILQAPSGG